MTDGRPEPDPTGPPDHGAALADLLHTIARDIAHELRGPVQSAVVNLEVLRRRAQAGKAADVIGRADVVEEEVRRLHGLADAFLSLLREPAPEPVTLSVERLLATAAGPIIDVMARSGRVQLVREPFPADVLIRVRPEPATLAVVRLCLGAVQAAGDGGSVRIAGRIESDSITIDVEACGQDSAGRIDTSFLTTARSGTEHWMALAGGTAGVESGSDSSRARVVIRLRRAT